MLINILRITVFLIAIIITAPATQAAELNARQLQEYCSETEKGFLGKPFDASKAEVCKGYMMGFFDSMIIADQFARKPQICVPASLPKTQNYTTLNSWVEKNKNIAETTTAAVALFSAYASAFPCKK